VIREAFAALRTALDAAGVRFALGGSWASAAFGEPRFTNDLDIVADITPENVGRFLSVVPPEFVFDNQEAQAAVRSGLPFHLIYVPIAFKFDFFSARAFPLGMQELDRAVPLAGSGISDGPVPFVTPEDILLAKLHWLQLEGVLCEVQWRDIHGLIRYHLDDLDQAYLHSNAATLGVLDLLSRAFDAHSTRQ
jgi:hypothetical protein